MTAPAGFRQGGSRAGPVIVAASSAVIVLALAFVLFGLAIARMPFAAIALAGIGAAVLYAYLMWRTFSARSGAPSLSAALVAGIGGPLVGAFVLDALQSVQAGREDGLGGSILLAFWPVTMVALVAGAGGGWLALASGRRRP